MLTKGLGVVASLLLVGSIESAQALEIVQPTEGQRVEIGSLFRVVVKPDVGEHWLGVAVAFKSLSYDSQLGAYVGEFPVPKEASLGPRAIMVSALSDTKKEMTLERQIVVVLPSNITLQSLQPDPTEMFLFKLPTGTSPLRVEHAENEGITVMGVFSDGVEREISSSSLGTSYETSDPKVATVNSEGVVTAVTPGEAIVTVKNNGKQARVEVSVRAKR